MITPDLEKRNKDQNTVSIVNSSKLLTNSVSTRPKTTNSIVLEPGKTAVLRTYYHAYP